MPPAVLFEDVGEKVEGLRMERQSAAEGSSQLPATNSAELTADGGKDEQKLVDEIESLCMNCGENGITRLLLTRIPYFKEIILMSFYCSHCHFRNNEIQSAGEIQQRGSRYIFRVEDSEDMSRQVVRSDTAIINIRELDLEIPAGRGQLTNIEGLLSGIVDGLCAQSDAIDQPELRTILDTVRFRTQQMLRGEELPFTLEIDDPAGNSFIQPSVIPEPTGKYVQLEYNRTPEQNEALSLTTPENDKSARKLPGEIDLLSSDNIVPDEVYSFPASCPGCSRPCVTNMKMVDIPHFKAVVLMSTVCEDCGYRSNEVKTGGEVPAMGRRITLEVQDMEDLSRDVLKSETCHLSSPELNLSVQPGTLGGRFTTVEGLLTQIRDDLRSKIYDIDDRKGIDVVIVGGDSQEDKERVKWDEFFKELDKAIKAEKTFTIVMEDPLAASYVQSLTAPDPDPQLTIEDYTRTDEEEEDLGLKDMRVENYAEDANDDSKGVENESHKLNSTGEDR